MGLHTSTYSDSDLLGLPRAERVNQDITNCLHLDISILDCKYCLISCLCDTFVSLQYTCICRFTFYSLGVKSVCSNGPILSEYWCCGQSDTQLTWIALQGFVCLSGSPMESKVDTVNFIIIQKGNSHGCKYKQQDKQFSL